MKLKRVATICEDFAFGHEQVGAFLRVFEENGGKVVKKLWPPLNAPDFTPFIAQIGNVDGVFMGFAGSNPLKFLRAYADLGLKGQIPVTGGWTALDDALLKSFGDEAVGAMSATFYTSDHNTESNKRFVAAMAKDYDVIPGAYSAGMYIAGQCVEAAIAKLDGKTDDKQALMAALKGLSLTDTPRGAFSFDQNGNVVGDVFIRRCERQGGKLVNKTIKTYEKVSQFWTYDPAEFVKQPVYSRDYPPAKNLQ
jgi:branched-chain amino acid transport system substrate-binding protein